MKKIKWIALLCVAFATMFFNACGDGTNSTEQSVLGVEDAPYPAIFKPADEEYPYAGIPRIVIETENRQAIKSRKTEIPAKLQIWGEKEAESEVLDLTIRGRGNTSWGNMPKKSYKIEFEKRQSMLGMPKDKDWALISNYADRSLLRNYTAYRLSAALGAYYAPKCEFAELYLNGEYLGLYLLSETVKIGKNRINIPEDDYSYIVEVDEKYDASEQVVFSDVLITKNKGKAFRVHDPKDASTFALDSIEGFIRSFENHLMTFDTGKDNDFESWIDVGESVKHYWVQEFSKNPDAEFYTSVYFSWVKGEKIKMGPVWDFDLAYGNHKNEKVNSAEEWYMRKYWYFYLYRDLTYKKRLRECWLENKILFERVLDSIDVYRALIEKASQNNFKRWDILNLVDDAFFHKLYSSYNDAVEDLKEWISQRFQWINRQYEEK